MWLAWILGQSLAEPVRADLSTEPLPLEAGVRLSGGPLAVELRAGPSFRLIRSRSEFEYPQPAPTATGGIQTETTTLESWVLTRGASATTQLRARIGQGRMHGWWQIGGSLTLAGTGSSQGKLRDLDWQSSTSVYVGTGPGLEAPLGRGWRLGFDLDVVNMWASHSVERQEQVFPGLGSFPYTTEGTGIGGGLGGAFRILIHGGPRPGEP